MSEQPVNPQGGTEPMPITDEQSAVSAISDMLEPEEAKPAPKEQPAEDNLPEDQRADNPDEPEPEAAPEDAPEATDDSVELPSSLADLTEALGVEPEDFMNIKTTVKVDGKATEVTLAEAIAGYQKDADYRQKTESLATQRREFEAQTQQANAQFQQKAQALDGMIEILQAELGSGPTEADLAYLIDENPAEYIRQTNALKQRAARLAQFQHQRGQMLEQEQQEMHSRIADYRRKEQQALLSKIPGLDNPEKGNAVQRQVAATLGEFGYSEDEVKQYMAGPFDHRLIVMAMELNDLKQQKAKGSAAVKKIALKPKVSKPGVSKGTKGEDEQRQELRNRIRRHGRDMGRRKGASDADAQAFVKSLL